MAAKRKKKINRTLTVTLIILLVVFSVLFYKNVLNNESSKLLNQSQQNQKTTYSSPSLKLKINIPTRYQVAEAFNRITLSNASGRIIIDSTGTNFKTIDEYLEDLTQKNNLNISSKQKLVIDGKEAIEIVAKGREQTEKDIMIYATEWTVYTFSTTSEELYPDLDQIAQSFKYTP